MSIQEIYRNFKRILGEGDTRLAALIILVGVSSFGLGRLSSESAILPAMSEENSPSMVIGTNRPALPSNTISPSVEPISGLTTSESEGGYVASKNGTKYHLPWCGSAKQIKEENKIWFATKAEAEAAGYAPASNCKGI